MSFARSLTQSDHTGAQRSNAAQQRESAEGHLSSGAGSSVINRVLSLQRTIGNRAVVQMLAEGAFRHSPQGEVANNGELSAAKSRSNLPESLKAGTEALSGVSLDDVKVHYNSSKPRQFRAHAIAQGSEIHMAPGQEGNLPHETWHIAQQKQGRVSPTGQRRGSLVNQDSGLEREADIMGARASQGGGGMGGGLSWLGGQGGSSLSMGSSSPMQCVTELPATTPVQVNDNNGVWYGVVVEDKGDTYEIKVDGIDKTVTVNESKVERRADKKKDEKNAPDRTKLFADITSGNGKQKLKHVDDPDAVPKGGTIVFAGHGGWVSSDEMTNIPKGSTLHGMSNFGVLVNDDENSQLVDLGALEHLPEPAESSGPFSLIQNYSLYPPRNLTVGSFPEDETHRKIVWTKGMKINDDFIKVPHIQILTNEEKGMTLRDFFTAAPRLFQHRTLIWSACRQVKLPKKKKYNSQTDKSDRTAIKKHHVGSVNSKHTVTLTQLRDWLQEYFNYEFSDKEKPSWAVRDMKDIFDEVSKPSLLNFGWGDAAMQPLEFDGDTELLNLLHVIRRGVGVTAQTWVSARARYLKAGDTEEASDEAVAALNKILGVVRMPEVEQESIYSFGGGIAMKQMPMRKAFQQAGLSEEDRAFYSPEQIYKRGSEDSVEQIASEFHISEAAAMRIWKAARDWLELKKKRLALARNDL